MMKADKFYNKSLEEKTNIPENRGKKKSVFIFHPHNF